jgi:hypothetical protein
MELVGPAPFPKVTASSTDAHREGGQVEVQLPLWRIVDAVEACKGRRSTLPSVVLTGTLRCEGLAPLTVEVSAPLALTCAPAAKAFGPRWDALRVRSAETLVTGPNAPTTVSVWWDVLRPTPRAVTVVELDDGGAVLTRHQALTPSSALNAGNSEAFVRLDTSRPRVVSLALELAFPDGSIALSAPQTVSIVTPAQREADLERSAALSRRMTEVHDQLNQAFTNPCSNPDAAVIWLNIQPGVSQATNFEGHNLSYLVGGRPVVLMCHDLWSR